MTNTLRWALLICLFALGGARAESFDSECKRSLAETMQKTAKNDPAMVGSMWRPNAKNQYPWDHGYLDAVLQACRGIGFSEGRRWRDMVKLSRSWVHPGGAYLISRDAVYQSGRDSFGAHARDFSKNGSSDLTCECVDALTSYGRYGTDLSETLEFKAP